MFKNHQKNRIQALLKLSAVLFLIRVKLIAEEEEYEQSSRVDNYEQNKVTKVQTGFSYLKISRLFLT